MAGQGVVTWSGLEIPFIYGKVSIDTAVGGGALPGQNRSNLVVDIWFRADHADDGKVAAVKKADRKKLFENALNPNKEAQGKLIVTFSEAREGTAKKTAQYQLEWAWITQFSDFTPMEGPAVPQGMAGPVAQNNNTSEAFNQLVHCRWVNVPEQDAHKANIS